MQKTTRWGVVTGRRLLPETKEKKQKRMIDSKENGISKLDTRDVSAEQSRVRSADHERQQSQQHHGSRTRGIRAHKSNSDDLDREKRNKSQNIQQDVFHNDSLLKELLPGASDPLFTMSE